MSITLTCDCGKRLRVKDEMAGKKGKCPECGRVLAVNPKGVNPPSIPLDTATRQQQAESRTAQAIQHHSGKVRCECGKVFWQLKRTQCPQCHKPLSDHSHPVPDDDQSTVKVDDQSAVKVEGQGFWFVKIRTHKICPECKTPLYKKIYSPTAPFTIPLQIMFWSAVEAVLYSRPKCPNCGHKANWTEGDEKKIRHALDKAQ